MSENRYAAISRAVERDVEKVRARLDYPDTGELADYREALEALDRLARLAHAHEEWPFIEHLLLTDAEFRARYEIAKGEARCARA